MLKQGLEQKQIQKLSPLQIQTIKLIELPVQELEQRVRDELNDNPVLDDSPQGGDSDDSQRDVSISEIEDKENSGGSAEDAYSSYSDDDSIPSYNLHVNNYGKDERPEYNTFSVRQSFSQSLMEQLGFRNLGEHQRTVAAFIIGSLDDDGYLRRDVETLVDDLAFRANIETTPEEVEDMLRIIQDFEPVGVGARDLRECLLIQLRNLKQTPEVKTAIRIVDECFQDFSNKHFQKIVPDFILDEHDGVLDFTMPRFNVPEIRVNKKYADLLMEAKGSSERSQKEAAAFVKQKLDSAKWFVEALKQRQNTLSKTMRAILDYQHDYFIDGDESNLRPMVLKDIAEITGFDISTISRVVNSKFIETHFGIFPLKYFFSEGMENKEGEEVSTRELKKALKECVDAEDKKKPLTDEQLVVEMARRGYNVARRTIAKYRGQLGIPLARWRKEI